DPPVWVIGGAEQPASFDEVRRFLTLPGQGRDDVLTDAGDEGEVAVLDVGVGDGEGGVVRAGVAVDPLRGGGRVAGGGRDVLAAQDYRVVADGGIGDRVETVTAVEERDVVDEGADPAHLRELGERVLELGDDHRSVLGRGGEGRLGEDHLGRAIGDADGIGGSPR